MTQIDPPPVFQASPLHVSEPGSPGAGTVLKRQISLPVAGSYAAMNPLTAVFAAADADDHLVLHDERRQADGVSVGMLGDLHVPEETAAARIDGDEACVERAHEQRVAEDRQPAIVGAAAHLEVRRDGMLVDPEDPAGLRIHREDVVGPLGQVHDAVHDERRRLPRSEDLVLQHPLHLEVLHVARIDLAQRAVPLTRVGAGVGQPVVRLGGGVAKPVARRLGRQCNGGRDEHGGGLDGVAADHSAPSVRETR